jgi:predicted HD superfamily hydrolase involved in NAD metabolism
LKKYDNLLNSYLSPARLNHCTSTANFMKKYSKFFNIDKKNAYIAGLLHDIAKELSNKKIIELSIKFKNRKFFEIEYFEFKLKHPNLLHGVASAEIMHTLLNITNNDILKSACSHTFGGRNLSDLQKLTFISDYCEPLRNYPPSKKVHNILVKEKDLNKAYLYTYIYIIQRVTKKQKLICPESIDGYNEAVRISRK